MVKRHVFVIALAAAALVVACQIVAGIERVDKTPAAAVDASDVVTPPTGPTDPCPHENPPPISASEDDNVELPTFAVAIRTLDLLAKSDAGTTLGYDLDRVCTCNTSPLTFGLGKPACAPRGMDPKIQCDGEGGVDNQSALLFGLYDQPPLNINEAANVNDTIGDGHQTILLSISKYNGRANDREVLVGLLVSRGLRDAPATKPGCTSTLNAGTGEYTPAWCGDDAWSITRASTLSGTKLPARTAKGYVTNYRLVANVLNGDTVVPFGPTAIGLGDAIFTGQIVPLDTSLKPRDGSKPPTAGEERLYAVDHAVMAGRLPVHDMLAVAGTFAVPFTDGGKHLCADNQFFVAQGIICSYLDLPTSAADDLDAAAPCNALSFAASFSAFPALVGDFYDPPPEPNECIPLADGGVPPTATAGATYDCP
jgi:hypothetical protein